MKRTCCAMLLLTALLFCACMPAAKTLVQPEPAPTAAPAEPSGIASFSIVGATEPPAATLPPGMSPSAVSPSATCVLPDASGAIQIDPDKPMVALTFDDGPTAGVTDAILDVLEKYNAHATFFVVGSRIAGNEKLLQRAVALGCEIGNHTWDHINLKESSPAQITNTLQKTNQAVLDATGHAVRSLRPPEGASDDEVKAAAGALDMAVVFWSHSTHDYRIKSAERIAELVFYDSENEHTLADGDIVLMHDLRNYTSEAMEAIVSRLISEGYQLLTVQELLQFSEIGFQPGTSYKRR